MIDGLGAARSGLSAQVRRMDALAGDIANVNSAGYAPQRTSFSELVSAGTQAGVELRDLGPDFSQGALHETGRPLDLAIEGEGFFQVSRPGGQIALVRAGAFGVDASGQVVTATGDRLFPPLALPPGADPQALAIDPRGVVSVNGQQIGQVQVVTVPAPGGLLRTDGGAYTATPASGAPVPAPDAEIRQGVLEASGTDLAEATVETMTTRTAFTASIGSLHAQDAMFGALMELADRHAREGR